MRSLKLMVLFVSRSLGLFRIARRLTCERLKILCYHGFELVDEAAFRPKLFIKPDVFERRLATIKRLGFHVLSLDEAVDRLYAGTLPKDALVITVDDGFYSFHRLGVPLLRRYGFPGTIYVTTYYVMHANPIFRLVVQYLFWRTQVHELRLLDVPWSDDLIVNLADAAQVERAMWNCINYGEGLGSEEARCAVCEQLGKLLKVPYDQVVQSRALQLMSPDELRSLASSGVTVELHTHRHTFPVADQRMAEREILDNRAALATWLGGEKRHFCYPSGLWEEQQWSWLDGMRVKSSTTCVPGLNDRSTPRHALRRFLDGANIHQLEFEAAMSGFSDILRGLRPRK